jgi:hypothetical protein
MIPIEAGENRIQVTLTRTWDRTVGGVISIVAALSLLLWFKFQQNPAH